MSENKARIENRGTKAVRSIEHAWEDLQRVMADRHKQPGLPSVVVVLLAAGLRSRRYGHFAPACWRYNKKDRAHEIAISPHLFASAENLLAVLVHEAAHALNFARNIRDCSGKGNYYHLVKFRKTARELGLLCEFLNGRYGWTITRWPEEGVPSEYKPILERLQRELPLGTEWFGGAFPPGKKTPAAGHERLVCRCPAEEGRSVYASKSVVAAGGVYCTRCEAPFVPAASADMLPPDPAS